MSVLLSTPAPIARGLAQILMGYAVAREWHRDDVERADYIRILFNAIRVAALPMRLPTTRENSCTLPSLALVSPV